MRSATVGIPSGRCLPADLGMYVRRIGLGLIRPLPKLLREVFQVRLDLSFVLLDGDLVHARRAFVPRGVAPRRPEVRRPMHLIDQAEPYASFDSVFQSLQHPVRPDRRLGPRPAGSSLAGRWVRSALCSPHGHWRRLCLHRPVLSVSTFLRALAPRELPRFIATTHALTPARPGSSALFTHEHRLVRRAGLFDSCT